MRCKRFFSLSYRTRLLLALLLVNIPVFLVLSTYEIISVRNFAFQRELDALNSEGQLLAGLLTDALIDHDKARLNDILSLAVRQPQISEASLLDSENTVITSTSPALIGKNNSSFEPASPAKITKKFYCKSFPVSGKPLHGKTPRYLQINYSLAKAYNDISSTLYWEVIVDLFEILVILIVAWFVAGLLQKPLIEMKRVTEKMAAGDFSSRVVARADDVIGRLAMAFNNMASRLYDLTNSMQHEIDAATMELTNRNRELRDQHQLLETSNKKLKELDILKSDFVAMVSHELRTPLTSIIGFAKTLKTLPLSGGQQKQYLDIIESEGKRLSSLVEEYLDISKIESGNISIALMPVPLPDLIRSAVDSFSVDMRKSIIVHCPVSMPAIMADGNRIKRVLYNLIDNAIKYSDDSREIIITVNTKENGVAVSVRDFGPGIDPDDMGKIFDKFYRGKNQVTAKHRGSGLGLAISKGILEAHNGKIWCESEQGKGATFTFFLPLKPEGA
jgi:signal transduction histidine kinase